jgi:hypothetical protein
VIIVLAQQELTIMAKMITIVMIVISNVKNVQELLITVLNVLKTESVNLNVNAHQEP